MTGSKPTWNTAPIPAVVRTTWPMVTRWRWVSPLRLWGGPSSTSDEVHLVVVDPLRERASGQSVRLSELTDPDETAQIYARLWTHLISEESSAGTAVSPVRSPGRPTTSR